MATTQAAWYTFPRIDNFGTIDPAGPYWKPDSNVQLPGNYPVTALLSGTVTSIQVTSWGQHVVTVKLDSPLNSLATHTFYEHLSNSAPGLTTGQHVTAGQLIGYNNPSGSVPLGFGLYSGDVYGSGSAWSTLQQDLAPGGPGLLNPTSLLNSSSGNGSSLLSSLTSGASGGGISIPGLDLSSLTSGLNSFFEKAALFVLALVFIGFGLYLTFQKQVDQAAGKAVKVGTEALLA